LTLPDPAPLDPSTTAIQEGLPLTDQVHEASDATRLAVPVPPSLVNSKLVGEIEIEQTGGVGSVALSLSQLIAPNQSEAVNRVIGRVWRRWMRRAPPGRRARRLATAQPP
jgi:hypothetical protein